MNCKEKKLKVAIITSGLLPVPAINGGAIETLLQNFIEQNEFEKKINMDIYTINSWKINKKLLKENSKNVNYIYINQLGNFVVKVINKLFKKNIPINYYYQKKVIKILNKVDCDYIITENYPELVLRLKSNKVIPYIHSDILNVDIDHAQMILNKSFKVIAVSDFIKERVKEIDITQENKIYTVYNSIDFKDVIEKEYNIYREKYRDKYGVGENEIVFAYSGRISEEKGVLELVRAFKKANIPDSKLLIIGGIWYHCNKTNEYLESIKREFDDKVILTGYINHKEVDKLLCAIDIGVVPSICNEAAGLSVVEFMARKNIVVASDKGGIKEYLNSKDNFLVEASKKEEFEEKLKDKLIAASKVVNDRERRIKNKEYSIKFNVKNNYNNIIRVLERD